MTDLTLTHRTSGDATGLTPAGLQPVAVLALRRAIVAALNIVTVALLAYAMATAFGLGEQGFALLDALFFLCVLVGLPWTVMGFWNAVLGLWLLHGRRDGLEAVAPYWGLSEVKSPLRVRTALLMTLRNEDPERAMARLAIVRDSLDATSDGAAFDYFVMSDTSLPDIAAAEEAWAQSWRSHYGDEARLTYRRREVNEGYKAGNVRDFIERYGEGYDFFPAPRRRQPHDRPFYSQAVAGRAEPAAPRHFAKPGCGHALAQRLRPPVPVRDAPRYALLYDGQRLVDWRLRPFLGA